tara:strand:+ start:39224 stop:41266 length:2043 start_codon:yes stop_codon:yes gene_type:complete
MSNPLLLDYDLPPFKKIRVEHIVPAIEEILKDNLEKINQVAKSQPTKWEALIKPLEALDDRLHRAWSPVSHLNSVMSNDALREAYNECLPKISDYATQVGQHQALFDAFLKIHKSKDFNDLDEAQQKVITNAIRDFKLQGIALPETEQAKFKKIKNQLSELQSNFQDNLLDATDAWHLDIVDINDLKGVPEASINLLAAKAKEQKVKGYRLGLDYPCFHAIVTYAENRQLRETMYQAFVTRASDQSPSKPEFDNSENINKILKLRQQLAQMLGYETYAHYSLERKMANSVEEVFGFLRDLAEKSKPFAEKEMQVLRDFAQQTDKLDSLQPWDMSFYTEKLRNKTFSVSQEALRPYFPVDKVLSGMFAVVGKVFGVQVDPLKNVETWHKDVQVFSVLDKDKNLRGKFFLDLFAREKKRQGAWMDDAIVRRVHTDQALQHPAAYVTCNFRPANSGQPALLTHDEVITLFHEFGHALHHMLTQIDHSDVSGINGVPWDAVELPSQFLENFCWQKEALPLISSHVETNEPLPEALFEKLLQTKYFMTGMHVVRQLEFALFDFRIHHEFDEQKTGQVQAILDEVRKDISVSPLASYNRFQHSFAHIFSGGYAAGYYSYLWAEVLSSDAFARFKEEGLFEPTVGLSFLENILEKGGSQEPDILFKAFRGRGPKIDYLLEDYGLLEN